MANMDGIFGESAKKGLLRLTIFVLAAVCLVFLYLFIQFKGLNSSEAMDSAQLARNIAEAKGYQTDYIRPFSMWLLRQSHPGQPAQLESHPDLVQPPVYPYVLAAWLKMWSPKYEISDKKGEFELYDGDLACAVLGCILFVVGVLVLYFWIARMVDPKVGTLVAALAAFSDYLWQWAISGTSWSLLFLLTVVMGWLLYFRLKSTGKEAGAWLSSLGLGLVIGMGFLTRYSYALWLLPVFLVVLIHGGRGKIRDAAIVLVVSSLVALPWILRNLSLTGMPLGLAGYSLFTGTEVFSGFSLMHNYQPEIDSWTIKSLGKKWFFYARQMWDTDLKLLGGNWMVCFFVAACFYVFKKEELQRVKWFVIYLNFNVRGYFVSDLVSAAAGSHHSKSLVAAGSLHFYLWRRVFSRPRGPMGFAFGIRL